MNASKHIKQTEYIYRSRGDDTLRMKIARFFFRKELNEYFHRGVILNIHDSREMLRQAYVAKKKITPEDEKMLKHFGEHFDFLADDSHFDCRVEQKN